MGRKKTKFALADEITKSDGAKVDEKTLAEIANVEKEFVDIQNYRRKQTNNLLGVFDGDNYVILDEMNSRLVDIPKKFDRFENNCMYVSSTLGSFVLVFRVDMEIEPDFCKGKLSFIEIESGVAGDTKHVTVLDEVEDVYSADFRAKLDERWHIYYGGQMPNHDDFLERYMKMQLDEVFFCRELVDVLSQLYVTRMLAYVAKMGEKGEKIEREFKELAKEYAEKDPDFPNKHELQKEILDKVLKDNQAFEEIAKTEEGQKIMKAYSQPLKNVRDKTYPSIMTEDVSRKKADAHQENSPSPAKKAQDSAGGGSSGGKAKKSGGKKKSSKYTPPKIGKPNIVKGASYFDFTPVFPTEEEEARVKGVPDKVVGDGTIIVSELPVHSVDDAELTGDGENAEPTADDAGGVKKSEPVADAGEETEDEDLDNLMEGAEDERVQSTSVEAEIDLDSDMSGSELNKLGEKVEEKTAERLMT